MLENRGVEGAVWGRVWGRVSPAQPTRAPTRCLLPSRLGGLGSVVSSTAECGTQPRSEMHFGKFWTLQNAPFCTYISMLWVRHIVRGSNCQCRNVKQRLCLGEFARRWVVHDIRAWCWWQCTDVPLRVTAEVVMPHTDCCDLPERCHSANDERVGMRALKDRKQRACEAVSCTST